MRKITLLTTVLVALSVQCPLPAHLIKIGNFAINGVNKRGFILDDGRAYKPTNSNQKDSTKAWQLGDVVMLMRKHGSKRYLLINTRTGEKAKMKNTHI